MTDKTPDPEDTLPPPAPQEINFEVMHGLHGRYEVMRAVPVTRYYVPVVFPHFFLIGK